MVGNNSVVILAVSWTETCIGLFFFGLRFLSNWKFVGRFRWDFAVAGLTVATEGTAQVFLQLSVNAGMGRHLDSLSDAQIVTALHWSWVFQLLAIAASMLGKLAILAFLVQIRGRHEKKPWFLIILGGFIGAVNIAVLGTILGQCRPMHKLWDDSVEGTCDPGRKMNQNYSFFQASFNAFSDILLALYPVHLFWKLQMKLRIKIALSILMGLGWIAAVCSAVKTPTHTGGRKPFDDDNPDWIELSTSAGTNGSEEHIVNGPKDVMIRTEIETRFEDVEGQVSPPSGDCSISAKGSIHGRRQDVRKVV
ncbi:hypothetical protein N7534_004011 [Penicillium rubens]|nr:hypothetical protein N7534_004011 [Penicillium rubens]